MGETESTLRKGAKGALEGKLLIASPGMPDPRFQKSVIFMCAHSENGAMGIIINKPFAGLAFGELMKKLGVEVTSISSDTPVMCGGPVETEKGFVLHSVDYKNGDATLSVTD